MDKTTIAIIGGALVVGAGAWWWFRREQGGGQGWVSSRFNSIDRTAASGGTAPYQPSPEPTIFEALAGYRGPDDIVPPPPPPADCGPAGGPGSYRWDPTALGGGAGACVMVPYPVPQANVAPAPAPRSCGTFDVVCKAKRAASSVASAVKGGPVGLAKGFVDLNKAYAGYSVDQFKRGAAITGAKDKANGFLSGQTRGAA